MEFLKFFAIDLKAGLARMDEHETIKIAALLQLPRCYRRSLLRRMEQTHRPAVENHLDRTPRMGPSVMVNGTWY